MAVSNSPGRAHTRGGVVVNFPRHFRWLAADRCLRTFDTNLGGSNAAWIAIENLLFWRRGASRAQSGGGNGEAGLFAADYIALLRRRWPRLIAGNKPTMTADEWAMTSCRSWARYRCRERRADGAKDRAKR